ncbi:response regulator [Lachnospiraceae bacterium OF09-33XD]|nr:response regulator [Lachnospiraceae bacterium OF09-33XD]
MDKVMIIDDEIWVTEVIRNIIDWKKFGFEIVSVCHDGEEAMSVIREIQPELLLTDIRMPGKQGWKSYRKLLRTSGKFCV